MNNFAETKYRTIAMMVFVSLDVAVWGFVYPWT
jgi:hypothetical protein